MTAHYIAQVNIARMLAPIDSAIMAGFVAQLDEVNALAERSPGFVWRMKTEDGDATAIRPYDDDMIIVNMSVWESPAALHDYVYRSAHVEVMKRRRDWFARMADAFMALWWIPAGHTPTVAEAVERIQRLRTDGPTPFAFTFKQQFPPPDADSAPLVELSDECPV